MTQTATSILTPWANFYIMTGSSAAALTGLMFIVITLVMGTERLRKNPDGISAFSTPTVVHFGAALFVSAVLSAPWHGFTAPAVVLSAAGLTGAVFILRVSFLTRRLMSYSADREDWVWYSVLPFIAYAALFAGAVMLVGSPAGALFAVGSAVALLIIIGIRNAWDIVTYLALQEMP